LVFGAISVAPNAFASGVIVRCAFDSEVASQELPIQKRWDEAPIAMRAEADFLQTAKISEIKARDWKLRDQKQEGAYTLLAFQGRAYEFPPTVSATYISDRNGMWCVDITHLRLRHQAMLTLDMQGQIVERDIRRTIATGPE
jgi:hypothetical protein